MSPALTKESAILLPLLEQFGVGRDATLIVHSAIGTLSRQGYRAEAIIEALLSHVANGNLLMPTMTWRTVSRANPSWDEVMTPSHTGVLTEIFRTRYATARSIHPTHSVAGRGSAASVLLSRHHIDSTPVSNNSPYGLLRDYDTYVLMIGVGLESCTAIHLPEEVINPDLYVRPEAEAEQYACRDRYGVVHSVRTRRHPRLERDFQQFSRPLELQGLLARGRVEGCPYSIVALRHLLQHIFAALIRNPQATLRQTQEVIA
jgi:aminoglycoside 3-N-acetyltransferase